MQRWRLAQSSPVLRRCLVESLKIRTVIPPSTNLQRGLHHTSKLLLDTLQMKYVCRSASGNQCHSVEAPPRTHAARTRPFRGRGRWRSTAMRPRAKPCAPAAASPSDSRPTARRSLHPQIHAASAFCQIFTYPLQQMAWRSRHGPVTHCMQLLFNPCLTVADVVAFKLS